MFRDAWPEEILRERPPVAPEASPKGQFWYVRQIKGLRKSLFVCAANTGVILGIPSSGLNCKKEQWLAPSDFAERADVEKKRLKGANKKCAAPRGELAGPFLYQGKLKPGT